MVTRTTTCSRDCPDVCTIQVEVDAQGRAVKLRGSAQDPVTRGFLCERTSRFLDRQYSPTRFTQPMWRPSKRAELEPVSWEFALDLCASRLLKVRAESGPASILHFRSGGAMGLLKQLSDVLFERFGPVTVKHGDICSGAGEAAQEADFGVCDSHDHLDLAHSKNIVLWGKNLHTSAPHLLPWLMELKQKGARLIGIDPVRTRQASLVDLFVQPNPGTDFALVMAILERLKMVDDPASFCDYWPEFQAMLGSRQDWASICGVSEGQIAALVEVFENGPTSIQVGWGMGRRAFGGANIRALDALTALSGNLGRPGGGCSYYYQRRAAFDSVAQGLHARSFAEARLGEEILAADPPVHFAWITAANPVSMLPDSDTVRRALQSIETVVVVETHPTDTTDVADLVLPTLTLLEDDDLLGAYGNHYLRVSQPTVEAPGEARHELWIWQQMAQRLQVSGLEGTPREWKKRLTGRLSAEAGVELEDLERGPVRNPFAPQVLFEDLRFPTETGKMQLIHQAPEFAPVDPEYPLQLSAFSTPKAQASQWSVAEPVLPEARVHPSCGIAPGEADLETRSGRMRVLVVHDVNAHPRQVLLPKGGTLRGGGCPNQLIRARETDIGGGANYYEEPARLRPA